jgi:hypothetical protein
MQVRAWLSPPDLPTRMIFNINKTKDRWNMKKDPQDPLSLGHHHAFDAETENSILLYIYEQNGQCRALMPKELLHFIREHYTPQLIKGWMNACMYFLVFITMPFIFVAPCLKKISSCLFRVNILKDISKS